ncbi:MAG TPA: PKD domain-containing protein [Actinomycetota bacterium]
MRLRRVVCRFMLLGVTASLLVAVAASQARAAVVDAAPTWPIPADAPAGPPPIPALPAATDAPPPAEQIADPVTPAASCGGWYLQSSYGSRWPAGSSWWEYRCTSDHYLYYDPCPGPACDAFCPSCYVDIESHTDYFYWNGVDAAFYGQDYFYSFYYTQVDYPPGFTISAWWDTPTARWYDLGPYYLTVSTDGTGSGEVSSSPAGISCGYSCEASFTAGTAITLTATPDAYSIFTGWLGDCSGTGSCQVTIDQARSVTATFALKAFDLTVSKQGAGSGQVSSSPAGISCGDSCQASFTAGTAVTLTATPDASSIFTGWSGDCSGTDTCQVTVDQARSVTATFALNAPPHASFTVACAGLSCSFDGSGSADSDGSIATYAWDFGDGASGSGQTVSHAYGRAGSYTVTLTVTDNAGATATDSKAINPISLSARGYKLQGLQKADLSWSGPSGTSFDLYRSGLKIATVQTTAYTDNLNTKGSGSYTYKVCEAASTTCSNDATVSF